MNNKIGMYSIFFLLFIIACSRNIEPELLDIELSNCQLTPAFSNDIFEYSFSSDTIITKTNMSVVSSGYGAKIFYSLNEGDFTYISNGDISPDIELTSKTNTFVIIVINKNHIKTYKVSSGDKTKKSIELSALKITPGLLVPAFSNSITEYKLGVPNRGRYIYINPVSDEGVVSYSLNNSSFTVLDQGKYSPPIAIKVGANTLQIQAEKEEHTSSNYSFNVIRYENADLKSIAITPGIFAEQLSPENSSYTALIKPAETAVTFELFPADPNATISMYNKKTPQKITLPVNSKYEFKIADQPEEFIAIVRAVDGYRRYYTFKINRL